MNLKSVLEEAVCNGELSIQSARRAIQYDWRSMIKQCPEETRRDAETLFYFIEGFVEEFDEGFIAENNDPELYEKTRLILLKL